MESPDYPESASLWSIVFVTDDPGSKSEPDGKNAQGKLIYNSFLNYKDILIAEFVLVDFDDDVA